MVSDEKYSVNLTKDTLYIINHFYLKDSLFVLGFWQLDVSKRGSHWVHPPKILLIFLDEWINIH